MRRGEGKVRITVSSNLFVESSNRESYFPSQLPGPRQSDAAEIVTDHSVDVVDIKRVLTKLVNFVLRPRELASPSKSDWKRHDCRFTWHS